MSRVVLFCLVTACCILALVLLVSRPAGAQQAPEWRELGSANGVELWEVRTGRATCYVTSAGGVSCK